MYYRRCIEMPGNADIPLYLFAKAPLPGQVKTRMQPPLTTEGCAELALLMLQQSVQKIVSYWPGSLVLCVSPDINHQAFTRLAETYNCDLVAQIGVTLGDRMLDALNSGIESSGSAVVMGCDVPHVTDQILLTAYREMCCGRSVIGPAEDGGFYLLGAQQWKSEFFSGVDWGSNTVLTKVEAQALDSGLELFRLPILRDIDHWRDLVWLADLEPRYRPLVESVNPELV